MPALITYSLGATIVALLAIQTPFPVEMSALVMVGLVLRWFLRKESRSDSDQGARITRLENSVLENRVLIDEQRHLKHVALNRIAGVSGMLMLIRQQVNLCTCGSTTALIPILDQIINSLEVDDTTIPGGGTST